MYNENIEELIKAALADGVLTEKEKQVLFKKAQAEGIDLDEFEIVLDARLVEMQKAEKEKVAASAPQSNKFGDVRKCPVCGAIAQAYQAKCPECGYEFSNVGANLSSQKLAERVMDAKNEADRARCITLFPIPNTKADLLEFLTSLQPKMRDIDDTLSHAYFKKYQECVEKAKMSFSSDPLLLPFIESLATEEKAIRKKRRIAHFKLFAKRHKELTIAVSLISVIVILFLILGVVTCVTADESNDSGLCNKAVVSAIKNNDLSLAEDLIEKYQYESYNIVSSYHSLCTAYLEIGEVEKAEKLVDAFVQNNKNKEDEVKKIITPLYKYLIDNGQYDQAEKYIQTKHSDLFNDDFLFDRDYYSYMKDCVEAMCTKGQIKEAKIFVKRKSDFFTAESTSDKYHKSNVIRDLNALIATY